MDTNDKRFSAELEGNYISLKTWGALDVDNLDAPANAALALAKEHNIDLLLDDIRDIDTTGVSIPIQTKSMGILWKLRTFKKVAIVLKGSRVQTLFFSTLDVLHLNREAKFKGFDNTTDAIAWLTASKNDQINTSPN